MTSPRLGAPARRAVRRDIPLTRKTDEERCAALVPYVGTRITVRLRSYTLKEATGRLAVVAGPLNPGQVESVAVLVLDDDGGIKWVSIAQIRNFVPLAGNGEQS